MLSNNSFFTRKESKVILIGMSLNNNSNWKYKLNHWLFNFHQEVIKTSVIGKKMLTASRTNAHLKETYEELGRLLEKAIENGEVQWDSAKMRALLHTIKACQKDLDEIEKQVHKIKFASGPEDISRIHIEDKTIPESTRDDQSKD